MSNHTPGPWKAEHDPDPPENDTPWCVWTSDMRWVVANVLDDAGYWPDDPSHNPAEANARLIASAPSLADQVRRDRDRFRSFARYAREYERASLADEFDLFARECDEVLGAIGEIEDERRRERDDA